jgi:hypothetical protein
VLEVAGIVAAGLLLRALLGHRLPVPGAAATAVAALLTVLAVPGLWFAVRGLYGVRQSLQQAPGVTEREKCLVDGGHGESVGVSRWLQGKTPADARLVVRGPIERVCLQLTLLPRLMVRPSEPHDFSLYAGKVPASVRDELAAQRALPAQQRTVEALKPDVVLVKEG